MSDGRVVLARPDRHRHEPGEEAPRKGVVRTTGHDALRWRITTRIARHSDKSETIQTTYKTQAIDGTCCAIKELKEDPLEYVPRSLCQTN